MNVSSIIDIVFVVLLILLAVIGLYRGFLKSAISVVGSAASAVISYFIAEPFGKLLNTIFKLTDKISKKIADWLYSLSEFFSLTRTGESFSDISGQMATGGVSGMVQKLANVLLKGTNIPEGKSVGAMLADKIAVVVTTVIAFAVAFILIRIILKILEKLADKITEAKIFGAIDKILGFVFGLAKGLIYSAIVVVMISVVGYFVPSLDGKIDNFVNGTKAFQKYYDWINYEVCEYVDEKLGKTDADEPKVVQEVKVEGFEDKHIAGITHAYVIRDTGATSGVVYFGKATMTKTNYATIGDIFIKYKDSTEYDAIMAVVEAHGTTINVAYNESVIEKTKEDLATILPAVKYYFVDTDAKLVVFKKADAAIDTDNYLFDCDYKIAYTEDSELTEIRAAITTYNDTADDDVAETTAS